MPRKLVIYGTGLVAEVVSFYFNRETEYEVCAFTNSQEFVKTDTWQGKPLVAFEKVAEIYPPNDYEIFIALGYNKTNQIRQQRFAEAKRLGYRCASYISPKATYYGTPVGENCLILENNVIQPFVTIGDNVVLWSGNHIGHHSSIADHCFISSHVVISGACLIGENCFIGVNATLRDNITLGAFTVVAAGAAVMKDCERRSLVQPAHSSVRVVERDLL